MNVRLNSLFEGTLAVLVFPAGADASFGQDLTGGTTNAPTGIEVTNSLKELPVAVHHAWDKVVDSVRAALTYPLIPLGGGSVTLAKIFKLLFLFLLVLVLEALLRRFFLKRVLKRTPLDLPLQYAIARISGYVFILIGFYVALMTVGLPLGSLAVVAGGLGVGLGFGLQNIVHNIVSGIIILAERPIALGDRIEVAGVAGQVSKIRPRSTEIITNDNISSIVPNSDFVTHSVTNWSQCDPRVPIRIPVGVAYGTDVDKLKIALQEVATENPDVLRTPPPAVYFEGFGDSALLFELGVWTSAMTHSPRRFRSDLNFAIERKLREHHIEIPFPQRDLHLKSGAFVLQNGGPNPPPGT
jgi:small-conductance mechanosensitive channel